METALTILLFIALFLVLASLGGGFVVMIMGGDSDKKYSNQLMRFRVFAQGIALLIFAIILLLKDGS